MGQSGPVLLQTSTDWPSVLCGLGTFDLIAGAVPAHIARVADADDDAWTVSAHDAYEDV